MSTEIVEDKPKLLKAVELILAKPEDIKKESIQLMTKFKKSNPSKSEHEIQKLRYRVNYYMISFSCLN